MKQLLPWKIRRKIVNDFLKLLPIELWDIIFGYKEMKYYRTRMFFEPNLIFYGSTGCLYCLGKYRSYACYDNVCTVCINSFTKSFYEGSAGKMLFL